MKRWQKHLIAWSVVLIVITAALIHGPDANATELIIAHSNGTEIMEGSIIELHDGYVDFHVDTYDSYAFDTIFINGFDAPAGDDPRRWNVVLEFAMDDVAFFSYYCGSHVTATQIVLYCLD